MSENHLKLDFGKICHKLVIGPKLPIDEINRKRNLIIERLNGMVKQEITLDNFERVMTPTVLNTLVNMYDELFFDNNIQKSLQEHGCVLTVCFNKRCLKVAGKCYYKKRCKLLEIHLSSKVFRNALTNRKVKVRINSGLECDSILSCMLITFEHEFIHGLIACFCYNLGHSNTYFRELYGSQDSKELFSGSSNPKSGHSNVFMTIVNKKFGHTKYLHNLLAHDSAQLVNDPAYEFFLKDEKDFANYKKKLNIGDIIYFNHTNDVKSCVVNKKLKYKIVCRDREKLQEFHIPYHFLVRPKSSSPPIPNTPQVSPKLRTPPKRSPPKRTPPKRSPPKRSPPKRSPPKRSPPKRSSPPKPKTPSPPKPKTPSPPKRSSPPKPKTPSPPKRSSPKQKKKVRFVIKSKKQPSNNSNNNKPILEMKTNKKSVTNYDGPFEDSFLAGLPKDYGKIYGRARVTDIEEIKRRCNDLGKDCSGFTQKNKNFSARKGKILKKSPSGERSWIKK